MVQTFDKSNWNVVFFICASTLVDGPYRTMFIFDFLEKIDLSRILQLLTVGAYEG